MADFVAKLDEEQLARNIRIEATEFLNQHCALALGLEIVLQQNRPDSEVAECSDDFRFLEYSGLVVLTASLSERGPTRTSRSSPTESAPEG
jgi:hypothetical protein